MIAAALARAAIAALGLSQPSALHDSRFHNLPIPGRDIAGLDSYLAPVQAHDLIDKCCLMMRPWVSGKLSLIHI